MLQNGSAPRVPQDESKVTLAPQIEKDDAKVEWMMSAQTHRQYRARVERVAGRVVRIWR